MDPLQRNATLTSSDENIALVTVQLTEALVQQQEVTNRFTERLMRLTRWLIVLAAAILLLTAVQAAPLFYQLIFLHGASTLGIVDKTEQQFVGKRQLRPHDAQ